MLSISPQERSKGICDINTIPRNNELDRIGNFARFVEDSGADAAIVADVGVMGIIKRYAPSLEIHMSTLPEWQTTNPPVCGTI